MTDRSILPICGANLFGFFVVVFWELQDWSICARCTTDDSAITSFILVLFSGECCVIYWLECVRIAILVYIHQAFVEFKAKRNINGLFYNNTRHNWIISSVECQLPFVAVAPVCLRTVRSSTRPKIYCLGWRLCVARQCKRKPTLPTRNKVYI